jgi:acyl carrier protein
MIEKVIEVVAAEVGRDPSELSAETRLDSLGMDSLEFVALMLSVAEEIAPIPDEKWVRIETIGDIAQAFELVQ